MLPEILAGDASQICRDKFVTFTTCGEANRRRDAMRLIYRQRNRGVLHSVNGTSDGIDEDLRSISFQRAIVLVIIQKREQAIVLLQQVILSCNGRECYAMRIFYPRT